jgi:hypothetical protein
MMRRGRRDPAFLQLRLRWTNGILPDYSTALTKVKRLSSSIACYGRKSMCEHGCTCTLSILRRQCFEADDGLHSDNYSLISPTKALL